MINLMKYLLIIGVIAGFGWLAFSHAIYQNMNINFDLSDKSDLSDEGRMLYSFIAREGKRLGKKYHMHLGSVGGGVDHGIWLMSLDFQRKNSVLTEEEARELIINSLNDYLNMVNNDEKLRPFLKEYPFKPENVDLAIFNYTADMHDIYHPYIGLVSADKGKIGYLIDDESNQFRYKSQKYESYDEAMAILKLLSVY